MAIYQLTFFFQVGNYGWSENYPTNVATPTDAETNFGSFLTLRLATMFSDCKCVGGRISDVNVKGDSYPLIVSFPEPGTYAGTGATKTSAGQNCLRVLLNSSPVIRANRYLHGIPNNQYTTTFYTPTSDWLTLIADFMNAIVSNSGTLTKIKGAIVPPFYTYTPYTGYTEEGGDFRKVGRPFGQPRGRRQIA